MKIKINLITVLVLLVIYGCSQRETLNPPGPTVTLEQAQEVAENVYGLTKIENSELRHLTESELQHLDAEQRKFTPVYYVLTGLLENEQIVVYVSSNEIKHHFVIKDKK